MGLEPTNGQMAESILDLIKMTRNKVLENIFGRTEGITKANGVKEKEMAMVK